MGTDDQRTAIRQLRKDSNELLRPMGYELQRQPYDHVLRDNEREIGAIENTIEYIARNPERRQLVPMDGFRNYPFTGSLLPGYPHFQLFEVDSWDRLWRIHAYLRRTQMHRKTDELDP